MERQTNSGLIIKPDEHIITRSGRKINLRKKEYDLLIFMVKNKNRVVNRLTLLEYVWHYNARVSTSTLEVHMASLRKKLDRGFRRKLISTIHGVGYKFTEIVN